MIQSTLGAIMLATIACAPGRPAAELSSSAASFDRTLLDEVLKHNVRDERVDYLTIRKRHWGELLRYLDGIASFDPAKLSRNEQLALYINLYNATMIRAVIKRFRDGCSPSDEDFAVFKENLVRVAGRTTSLNDLENKIIRPRFHEPRVHVALVCGALSCPPLLARAYRAEDLDEVLDANMRRFVNAPTRNRADREHRRLELSQIFNWYAEDFGGAAHVAEYVDRYHEADVSGFDVSFIEYSWELNIAAPRSGRWIKVTAKTASLLSGPGEGEVVGSAGQGEVFEVLDERNGRLRIDRPPAGTPAWIETRATAPTHR